MRTSLNEIKLIDDHLLKKHSTGDALLFDALLILNPSLSGKVAWQKNTIQTVQQYGRKQLKAEIEEVHRSLFNEFEHKGFRDRILIFFK
jgi:hypothetical protein